MLSKFNEFIKEATETEIDFLSNEFINDYFGDIKDLGYSYGLKDELILGNKNVIGAYFYPNMSDVGIVDQEDKKIANFILYFYKKLSERYDQINNIKKDIITAEECIEQYINCDELSEYKLRGININNNKTNDNTRVIEMCFQHELFNQEYSNKVQNIRRIGKRTPK